MPPAPLGPGNTGCQHGRRTRTPGSARESLPLALISYVLCILRVKANESLEASQKNNNQFYYVGGKPDKTQSAGAARTQRQDSDPVLRSVNANLCLAAAWLEPHFGLPNSGSWATVEPGRVLSFTSANSE